MKKLLILPLVFLLACKGFFGEKTDLSFIDKPVFTQREIAYVPIQPALTGFVNPVNVFAGYDQLFYVVDQGSSHIISYDVSGRELSRISVPGLVNASMNRHLDILAIGTYDTLQNNQQLKMACVYKITQSNGSAHGLRFAKIKPVIIHPYYKGIKSAVATDEEVKFTSIGIMADNTWYVARSGPKNNPDQLGGPDEAILQVLPDLVTGEPDKFVSTLSVTTGQGIFQDYFKNPSGISTFAQPPQDARITDSRNFIYSSLAPDLSIKVQYIEYKIDEGGGSFAVKFLESTDTAKADGFLYEPNKFTKPTAVTVAGDKTNYIFVVDSEKDSVFQFTEEGLEGVNPTLASGSSKQIKVSFGGTGSELNQFNNPTGVAYLNQILYVADAGNKRVLRFKLTTDFD
ncbi:MAG: hypothetical protein KDC83_03490 [Flavobacteriales bacterium]|nr:hypothetical protein [Flavobacteriales bacterium]